MPNEFLGTTPIAKVDEDRGLVFGWASIVKLEDGTDVVDLQGDLISVDELEDAAYEFTAFFGETGEMHKGEGFGDLVESMVFTEEKMEKLGLPPGSLPQGWWAGFHVPDDTFAKVKKGELSMFSIQGGAERRFAKGCKDKSAASFRQRMKRQKKKRDRRRAQDVLSGDLRMGKSQEEKRAAVAEAVSKASGITINIGDSAIDGNGSPEVKQGDDKRVAAAAAAGASGRRPSPDRQQAVASAARQPRPEPKPEQKPEQRPKPAQRRGAAAAANPRRKNEEAANVARQSERQPGRPRRPRSESARQGASVQER